MLREQAWKNQWRKKTLYIYIYGLFEALAICRKNANSWFPDDATRKEAST
jgi:hypothetical protein